MELMLELVKNLICFISCWFLLDLTWQLNVKRNNSFRLQLQALLAQTFQQLWAFNNFSVLDGIEIFVFVINDFIFLKNTLFFNLILIWGFELCFNSWFDLRIISEFGVFLHLESLFFIFGRFSFRRIFAWDFLVQRNFRLVQAKIRLSRVNFRLRFFFDRSMENIRLRIFFGGSSSCSSTLSCFWLL